jgi:hypothetical protein
LIQVYEWLLFSFGQILVILDFGPLVIGENVNAWNDYWIVQGIIISNMNIKIPRES